MENLVNKAKIKNPDLKKAEIEGIFYLILTEKGLTNADLVQKTGIPKETLRRLKDSISFALVEPKEDLILVKEEYEKELEKLDLKPYKWSLVDYASSSMVGDAEAFEKLVEELSEIRKKYGLQPKREYDQFFATLESSVSKALMLKDKGGVDGNDILFIGDDDLVSMVLCLMHKNGTIQLQESQKIMVLDIDPDILSSIEKISSDLGIKNVQTRPYDAREAIPDNLKNKFQVVMIDPPYTSDGIYLFLERSIRFLSKSSNYSGNYIYLNYGNSFKTPEKTLKIQEIIKDFNLLIEDKMDKFTRYEGAESIGNTSSMYVLKTTPATFIPKTVPSDSIYTYENKAEENFPYVEHYVIKIKGVPSRYMTSQKTLTKVFGDFCRVHKLDVVDTKITRFSGKGLTMSYILKQSNLTVHTWPEKNAIHIVVVTCSSVHKAEKMADTLKSLLMTDDVVVSVVR